MLPQLLMQIILPAVLVRSLWRARPHSRAGWALQTASCAVPLLFFLVAARWDWFSYYLRALWPILLAAAAVRSLRNIQPAAEPLPMKAHYFSLIVLVVVAVFSGQALLGYYPPRGAVELEFPLRDGCYYVGGGGANRFINGHFVHPAQRYALDIVRLNPLGRAASLSISAPENYAIFSDAVHSPSDGIVTSAVDGLPDLRPPERDYENLAGNHVVLQRADGLKVLLAHLKNGSLAMTNGQRVARGDLIGRVGNSGNTSQPHLHIHVERGGSPSGILDGEGVPIHFNGRFLVRNSLVFAGHPRGGTAGR